MKRNRIITIGRNTVALKLGRLTMTFSLRPKRDKGMRPAPMLSVPTLRSEA